MAAEGALAVQSTHLHSSASAGASVMFAVQYVMVCCAMLCIGLLSLLWSESIDGQPRN